MYQAQAQSPQLFAFDLVPTVSTLQTPRAYLRGATNLTR
jgi:hypothetical protein